MKIKDMHSLYVNSLRDMYSAETQLTEALPKVIDALSSQDLAKAVRHHLEETNSQSIKVREILEDLRESPEGHECAAMEGLIEEASELMKSTPKSSLLDAALIGAMQKVEHYEIASYGTLRAYAMLLTHKSHATKLQSILEQESNANEILNEFALQVNENALEKNTPTNKGSSKDGNNNKPMNEGPNSRESDRKIAQKVGERK